VTSSVRHIALSNKPAYLNLTLSETTNSVFVNLTENLTANVVENVNCCISSAEIKPSLTYVEEVTQSASKMYNIRVTKNKTQSWFCHSVSLLSKDFNCLHLCFICVFVGIFVTGMTCVLCCRKRKRPQNKVPIFEMVEGNIDPSIKITGKYNTL
jgi:hypothetical protein